MEITHIPPDILILVISYLTLAELVAFAEASKQFFHLIEEYGWTNYHRVNPRPSMSLSNLASWTARQRVKHHVLADRAWGRRLSEARPLAPSWYGKLQPLLAISSSRLVVAAAKTLTSYLFGSNAVADVRFEGTVSLDKCPSVVNDITAIAFVQQGFDPDRTMLVGFADGSFERVVLLPPQKAGQSSMTCTRLSIWENEGHMTDLLESISVDEGHALVLSSTGLASLHNTSTLESTSLVDLNVRHGWTTHLCMQASTPYMAFGTSSDRPLSVHALQEDHLSSIPFAILHPNSDSDVLSSTAVYGICDAPLALGSSNQIIISGWFDGEVRVHDLRSGSRTTSPRGGPSPLKPVMRFHDPLSEESIYTVSSGGGSNAHIAAGTARNSMVALFDVRSSKGWSILAPGNDRSPVYSLIMESTRVWGTTQSRAFVYDFGSDITPSSYPTLPHDPKLKVSRSGMGFYVTQYDHDDPPA